MAYTARYERDESGWWIVEVPEVQGCRSQGRTLESARERIREALGLFVDDAATAAIVDDIRLPIEGATALQRMRAAREEADRAAKRAALAQHETARVLTKKLGLSVRDAAGVLGLSHQRVQQIAVAPEPVVQFEATPDEPRMVRTQPATARSKPRRKLAKR